MGSHVYPQIVAWQDMQTHAQNVYLFISEQIASPFTVKETQCSQLAPSRNGAKLRASIGFPCHKVGYFIAIVARLAFTNGTPGF